MHHMLTTAVKAARLAGDIIVKASDRLHTIKIAEKAPNDFYTEIDQRAEQAIVQSIQKFHPTHGFLGEEFGQTDGDGEHLWIIDPLDGTTNFVRGIPHYCVSIALRIKHQIEHAVIYDPVRDELFTASRGAGAQLNGRRLRLDAKSGLQGALLSIGLLNLQLGKSDPRATRIVNLFGTQLSGIRRCGSTALDLAYVASGRLGGCCEQGLKLWDIAAGQLIVREAGGLVSDFQGETDNIHNGEIIASKPKVFAQLISCFSEN